jgi:hypothetical protein
LESTRRWNERKWAKVKWSLLYKLTALLFAFAGVFVLRWPLREEITVARILFALFVLGVSYWLTLTAQRLDDGAKPTKSIRYVAATTVLATVGGCLTLAGTFQIDTLGLTTPFSVNAHALNLLLALPFLAVACLLGFIALSTPQKAAQERRNP